MVHIASDEKVFDQRQAAEFCRMSPKTLERRANEGADLGRIKTGRRVIFLRSKLIKWLESLASESQR